MNVSKNPVIYFWASLLGSISLIAPVMTLFYLHRGLELSDLFVLLLIIVITMFFFEVPTGLVADKFGGKVSLIIGQLLALSSVVMLLFANSRIEFYIISFITGISITFFSGCDESLIFESLKSMK